MDFFTRLLLVSLCGCAQSIPLSRLFQRRRDAFEVYASEFARAYEPYMVAAIPLHAPVPVVRIVTRVPLQPRSRDARDAQAASSTSHAAWARPGYEAGALATSSTHYTGSRQYKESIRHYGEPAPRHFAEPPPAPARQYAEPARYYANVAHPYSNQEYEGAYSREFERPVYNQKPRRQAVPNYEYAADYSYAPQLQVQPSAFPQLTYLAPAPAPVATSYGYDAYASQEPAPTVLYARPNHAGGFTYRRVPTPSQEASTAAAATTAHARKAPLKQKDEKDPPFIIKIHKYRIVKDDLI